MTKQTKSYEPSRRTLDRYAHLLVDFALGGGRGVKPGQWVLIDTWEPAIPLVAAIGRAVLARGANYRFHLRIQEMERDFFRLASPEQVGNFPDKASLGEADQADHLIGIWARDPHLLKGTDPALQALYRRAYKPVMDRRAKKEREGAFSWAVATYGTEAMAKEAGLSPRQYWEQIRRALFLDDPDPVARWKETFRTIDRLKRKLDALRIERLHVTGDDVDLWVTLGPGRVWRGGGGNNLPSFEIFTSPDWRGTEGWVAFSEPVYSSGQIIDGIRLTFQEGEVVKATARRGSRALRELLATDDGARRLGEFSLTDGRLSRITRFMADTLYDENRGGPQGNFHVALGMAFEDTFPHGRLTEARKRRFGYNESVTHVDIVSTSKRKVTAVLPGGRERVIYEDGAFTI